MASKYQILTPQKFNAGFAIYWNWEQTEINTHSSKQNYFKTLQRLTVNIFKCLLFFFFLRKDKYGRVSDSLNTFANYFLLKHLPRISLKTVPSDSKTIVQSYFYKDVPDPQDVNVGVCFFCFVGNICYMKSTGNGKEALLQSMNLLPHIRSEHKNLSKQLFTKALFPFFSQRSPAFFVVAPHSKCTPTLPNSRCM